MEQQTTLTPQPVLEDAIRKHMEEMHYADALNALAELVRYENVKPEFLYDGAYAYFMMGDYERAASWVNNTLTFDSNNRKARILLARICILEDRVEDGLAVFDFVLEKSVGSLSGDESREIREIVSYYVHRDEGKIRQHYPHIAAFMGIGEQVQETPKPSAAHAILESLKEKARNVGESANPPEAQKSTEIREEARRERDSILQQNISLREKVRLLNVFAGGYFYQKAYDAAEELLAAALRIDPGDALSLKNMAILLMELGQTEKAIQFASQIKYTDFALLRELRG